MVSKAGRKKSGRLSARISGQKISKRAFALTSQYGILPRAYFIYGSPGETQETIQETIDLINEIKPMSMISYILDIFPGTALYEDFQRRTKLGDDIWMEKIEDIMYFESDQRMSKDMILSFGRKLRSDFYSNLPAFADAINLVDREDLYVSHADFLSRLALTFSHETMPQLKQSRTRMELPDGCLEGLYHTFPTIVPILG